MARLNHYAIGDYTLPAPGSMPRDAPPVSGPLEMLADARLEEPQAARPFWDEGAVSGPRAELDIGADKRTST